MPGSEGRRRAAIARPHRAPVRFDEEEQRSAYEDKAARLARQQPQPAAAASSQTIISLQLQPESSEQGSKEGLKTWRLEDWRPENCRLEKRRLRT